MTSERLEEYYLISDFGIVPSIQEWAAVSTNEMMSFGLPVINFMTGSSKKKKKNIIVNGKNGYIINLQNVYDLSNKLIQINDMEKNEMDKMKLFTKILQKKIFKANILLKNVKSSSE